MFNEGDLIVYGASGVCRVGETIQMEGKDYLKLYPVFQRETIFMPLFSDKVRVRSVITREEAENVITDAVARDALPVFENKVQLLNQKYESIIKTYQCSELLYLIMSIHNKRIAAEQKRRKLGLVDERYLKRAEDLLYGEFSIALEIPRENVAGYIRERYETMHH